MQGPAPTLSSPRARVGSMQVSQEWSLMCRVLASGIHYIYCPANLINIVIIIHNTSQVAVNSVSLHICYYVIIVLILVPVSRDHVSIV